MILCFIIKMINILSIYCLDIVHEIAYYVQIIKIAQKIAINKSWLVATRNGKLVDKKMSKVLNI
jgi:hypothetical protein